MLELRIDFDSEHPKLIGLFDDWDDLIGFMLGFWEMLDDE